MIADAYDRMDASIPSRPPRVVVGFTGHMKVGKDTAAGVLVKEFGFVKVGFADALKREVCERFPRTLREVSDLTWGSLTGDRLMKLKPPWIRALLQEYGTEVRRADDPHYWVTKWQDTVDHLPLMAKVVVPDVRFENEVQVILAMEGHVVRIVRPGYTGDTHASERGVGGEHEVLYNAEGIKEFQEAVEVWWSWKSDPLGEGWDG